MVLFIYALLTLIQRQDIGTDLQLQGGIAPTPASDLQHPFAPIGLNMS